jgi:hypothetical protein
MNNLQSFFPGFNRWIGRGPKSALARIKSKAEAASLSSLSELSALFGRYIPDVLLQPAGRKQHSRQRVYSFRSTFWAFLSQVLSPNTACLEVVRKVQCFCSELGLPIPSSDDSAYCQARGKLSRDRLMEIHRSVAANFQQGLSKAWLWRGRQVRVVDGTGIRLPDTDENQKAYPQPSEQREGCGFPVMQVVACFCLHTGALLHWVSSKLTAHESPLLRGLLALLEPDDVLLADRGFSSYSNLTLCLKHRLDAVMRLHQARKVDLRKGLRLGKQDRLVEWKRPQRQKGWSQDQWKQLPKTMQLRVLRLQVEVRGFRVKQLWIVTTLTDPQAYPKHVLAQLYRIRWQVELYFRDIKTSMGMEELRCKTPERVEKEFILFAIAYNLLRLLITQAAKAVQVDPSCISFKNTADTLRSFRKAIYANRDKPRKLQKIIDDVILIIASQRVADRPDRNEPRAVKRRPKPYQRLTQPRARMRVSHSRRNKGKSRPKTPLT